MQVAIGAATVTAPSGQTYALNWAQDDSGHLHMQDFQAVSALMEDAAA